MNYKRRIKAFLCCLIVICSIVILLAQACKTLEEKTGRNRYQTFREIGEDVDVLFLGNSHMNYGVYPIEIWNEYGIAGYSLAGASFYLPMQYWVLREALLYSQPKLIVLDVNWLSEAAFARSDAILHTFLDGFPLSLTKLQAVKDFEYTAEGKTDQFDLLFNFSGYHNRWNELQAEDFCDTWNGAREGSRSYSLNTVEYEDEYVDKDVITGDYNVAMEYVEKTIQLAQENQIEILLVYIPQPTTKEAHAYYNYCYTLAEKYHINYIDLTRIDDLVDYDTDLSDFSSGDERRDNAKHFNIFMEESVYDNNAHLNASGANKVSSYLGQYIEEHYDIEDCRGQEEYEYWNEDYDAWLNSNIAALDEQTELANYLMMLADNNYDAIIEVVNPELWEDERYRKLVLNLGVEEEQLSETADFLVIQQGGRAVTVLNDWYVSGNYSESVLGGMSIFYNDAGEYGVYRNDKQVWVVTPEENETTDLRVAVYKAGTMEVVDEAEFAFDIRMQLDDVEKIY